MGEAIQINSLEYLAYEYYKRETEINEWEKHDRTKELLNELEKMVKNKEPINIAISGNVGAGKSVLGLTLTDYLNKLYNQHHRKPDNKIKMGIKQIASDQLDLLEILLKENREYEAIEVDEKNILAESGLDSTLYDKLYEWYSNVCAQKHLARINCQPQGINDPNSKIILNIIAKDTQKQETLAKLSWRLNINENNYTTDLGYIRINVEKTLKQKWYETYKTKKFQRMDIVLKNKIKNTRELQTAKEVLTTYKLMEPIIDRIKITYPIISGFQDQAKRELGNFHTILGEMAVQETIKGLLELKKEETKSYQRIEKLKEQEKTEQLEKEQTIHKTLQTAVNGRITYLENLIKIKTKYDEIWTEG